MKKDICLNFVHYLLNILRIMNEKKASIIEQTIIQSTLDRNQSLNRNLNTLKWHKETKNNEFMHSRAENSLYPLKRSNIQSANKEDILKWLIMPILRSMIIFLLSTPKLLEKYSFDKT